MTVGPGNTVRDLRPWAPAEPSGCTLLVLHHAGGSAASYAPLGRVLPADWRLLGLDLPGRVMTDEAPVVRRASDAVSFLLPHVRTSVTGPYAVFGHSMGALVAFELVRALDREGRGPVWLGLSGSPAPRHAPEWGQRRDLWPRDRLVRFMRELGGTPATALDQPSLVDRMVVTLRADLAIVDTYEFRDGPPLRTPLSLLRGRDDPMATEAVMRPWAHHTSAPVAAHAWPGGHFYLFDQLEAVGRQLRDDVVAARSTYARPT
jgi:surfactin synthase thioesterase subunit